MRELIIHVIALIIIIFILTFTFAYLIGTSDLPFWVKFYLLK